MTGVFVSYRRDPSAAWAGRIADRLRAHFGANKVFIDVVDIEPGVSFPDEVDATIRQADALIAVIDPHWAAPAQGTQEHPLGGDDWVTREVALALSQDRIAVIPVLIDGATMPAPDELPRDIRELAFRNAMSLSPTNFESDVRRLIRALEEDGVQKTLPKRIGIVRSLLICAVLGALALFVAARALDAAQQRRLRAEAIGPVVTFQGLGWERFEVTNARFRACVEARQCDAPGAARTGERFDVPDRADLPVVSVRADQAFAFCKWIGRRLPTRAEWQAAATRGGTAQWPWGDEAPNASRVNAINLPATPPPEPPAAIKESFTRLARHDLVTDKQIAQLIPEISDQAVEEIVEQWPFIRPAERVQRLAQLYTSTGVDSTPGPDPSNPDDVVVVSSDRAGGTSPANGVQHLVGNAAEWTSTTPENKVWSGASAATLHVVGGSFADDIESLESDLVVDSGERMDTVGFRCVESR